VLWFSPRWDQVEDFGLIEYIFCLQLEIYNGFLMFSYEGMIDVVRRMGLRLLCARSQFSFEGKDINS